MPLPVKISDFIRRHHVLTLATTGRDGPYCSNIFYAFSEDGTYGGPVFIFTSEMHTRHSCEALANPDVAASIVLETKVVGKIQGLQIKGKVEPVNILTEKASKATFLHRFPYAVVSDLNLWILTVEWIKMTDNTLGFGKKLIWQKDE